MIPKGKKYSTIDEYLAFFPSDVRDILQKVRETIRSVAPQATEAISYGIPTFKLNGNLVHFAGYAHHIGFYPTGEGVEAFKDELEEYTISKGTVQFPLEKPIPYDLIRKITSYRVQRNQDKSNSKPKK
jgi:uncharacterized protein YdhG (YjbR/CyaY superfamily)